MTPKFFDAHTHLNMQFEKDWLEVGKKTIAEGTWFVNVGADEKSSRLAVEQAHKLGEGCFATVGIHPTEGSDRDFSVIAELAKDEKVIAIGECGLEYFKIEDEDIKLKQCELFIKHIELALKLDKPLMIHCRSALNGINSSSLDYDPDGNAYQDVLEILRGYIPDLALAKEGKSPLKFDMHFFAGDWTIAKEFLDIGGYLSFPGVITFTDQYNEVVKNAPLDRILAETDAPFATPVPYRGKRNEPAYVSFVAEKISSLRSEPREEVLTALVKNAQRFYGLEAI